MAITILAWNIHHGGGARGGAIANAIAAYDPDVVVLTEFRSKPGANIQADLRSRGWGYCESTQPTGTENGVCVLARTPIRRVGPECVAPEQAVRWLDLELLAYDFTLSAVHIVTASPKPGEQRGAAKARFWDALLSAADRHLQEQFLLVGDFNTGQHYRDEAEATFHCAEHFSRLSQLGWTDLWRQFHGNATEYSWYSRTARGEAGHGFRLDHAFVSPSLRPRVRGCRYSHCEREAGTSDHSIMIVEVDGNSRH